MIVLNPQQTSTASTGFLEPEQVVKEFDLQPGFHIADFGAGHGYFTIPMAKIVGANGKVYAIDIQKSVLDVIRTKARVEHLLNIEQLWADLESDAGSKLKEGFIDFVVAANIFFQAEHKDKLLHEAYRILRSGGELAVIEWRKETPLGPPRSLRVDQNDLKSLAMRVGFQLEKELDTGKQHYGLLFIKP